MRGWRWLLLAVCCATAHAQVAVMHVSVPEPDPSTARVRDLFLGRSTSWSDGGPVTIILVDSPQADLPLDRVVGRDHTRLLRGWKRLVFSGAGSMPLLVRSDQEALERIAALPGSIAILGQAPVDPRWISKPLEHLPSQEQPPGRP